MPPSVYDTHCKGAGALSSTSLWGTLRRRYWQYFSESTSLEHLPPQVDLKGKVVIVSGANSGIGKEAAYIFAKWGATVILACRDAPSYEQHPTSTIRELLSRDPSSSSIQASQLEWWPIDYSNLTSVRKFGEDWKKDGRRCDLLINNAGIGGTDRARRILTPDGFELVHQVNFLAHCLVTLYVLPSMKNSPAPRIINTTSIFHFGGVLDFSDFNNEQHTGRGLNSVQLYCNAKLRLQVWGTELQRRLSRSEGYRHVVVHGCHPGFVRSNIWNSPTIRALPFVIVKVIETLIRWFSIDAKQGSLTLLHAALRADLGLPESYHLHQTPTPTPSFCEIPMGLTASIGGRFINRIRVFPHRPECDDPLIRARLWQRVLEDLGLVASKTSLGLQAQGKHQQKENEEEEEEEEKVVQVDPLLVGLPDHTQGVTLIENS